MPSLSAVEMAAMSSSAWVATYIKPRRRTTSETCEELDFAAINASAIFAALLRRRCSYPSIKPIDSTRRVPLVSLVRDECCRSPDSLPFGNSGFHQPIDIKLRASNAFSGRAKPSALLPLSERWHMPRGEVSSNERPGQRVRWVNATVNTEGAEQFVAFRFKFLMSDFL